LKLSASNDDVICRQTAEALASATKLSTTHKTLLVRLMDAERISDELKDVWEQIKVAYTKLIVCRALWAFVLQC
jgi:hypothetical protein